ncbi:MAG: 2Fe-2S iron-sulfur cluster binding domain-containing protein [Proteobacteria bacterium]|nr:2Fe-2S iron-sulfur cluster binding domain-containing protein [Pseudomonadota bacterium]
MPTVTLANDKRFEAAAGVAILDAARTAGIVLEHSCRTGRCGSCKTPVRQGRTIPLFPEAGLTRQERDAGMILTCARSATEDVVIDTEDLPGGDIAVKTLPCRIDALERLAPDVLRVRLRLPPTAALRYLPGQSIDVIGREGLRRSYSIANAPTADGKLELHIRQVDGGAFSRYWFDAAKAGDLLRLEGPLGTFFLRDAAGLDLVFLATGTGIAPVKAMLEDLAARPADAQPRSVRLLWGGRVRGDLYWQPQHPGLAYTPVLSRADAAWDGARGHVQDVLLQSPPDWSRAAVYACGSEAMIAGARERLVAAGLAPRRFLYDAFTSSAPAAAAVAEPVTA